MIEIITTFIKASAWVFGCLFIFNLLVIGMCLIMADRVDRRMGDK